MDMQSDINIKTQRKYVIKGQMPWNEELEQPSCYYLLPHSIYYVNLTVTQNCI
jgi:hypothetical protein